MAIERNRVAPLDELDDFEVAEGDPDVRGWEVLGAGGKRIGKVDELLADTVAMKVRYLDVEVDDELLGSGEDKHILIPIGYARLHQEDDQILVNSLNASFIATVPAYTRESITPDYETRLRTHFDKDYDATTPASTNFYAHDLYDEDRFYAGRRGTARRNVPDSDRPEFGELGRGVEGDGISPEDDLDQVHGV